MTSAGIKFVRVGRFAEKMAMFLFGRLHINMHMGMVDYSCIVAHDGLVPVAYEH